MRSIESGGWSRRSVLAAAAAAVTAPRPGAAQVDPEGRPWALPGPLRGRVVEVFHPGSVVEGRVRPEAVREMVRRGMVELTGEQEEAAAWRRFFQPGDRVGVKVCPVGKPRSISQPETLLEVIRGLRLAGVRAEEILLFDRYASDFRACGFDRILPPGVRWGYAAEEYDDVQTDLKGYDPEVFVEMNRVPTGQDPDRPTNRRSHLCLVVSRQVDKVVNVCALKDHASAGITMALKNISHGFVNNVSRSHASRELNWCDTFIPDVVGMPTIRRKVVLHIGDGLIGTYDGGPGNWNPHFRTWEYRSLFFATDPVAMDRIGWRILDEKRAAEGLPPLAETGARARNPGHEAFDFRQPQHVLLAGMAGLGEADLRKIDHRRVRLG